MVSVGELLNALTLAGQLPRTIIYPLNGTQCENWAVLAAGFCDGTDKAHVQLGAPWWFQDQQYGIERQFQSCGNLYPVSLSVGMLTDSRSFISYPRHELYRRVFCNYLGELCERLGASESTIRRDLNLLAERGMLVKVHGGAVPRNDRFSNVEQDIEEKSRLYNEEKTAIARYAASLLEDGDFVFIDAGTTTEKMIDFISAEDVTFVTNAFVNAKKLAQRGYKVFLPAGEIKLITEAIVGAECVSSLQNYNFTKCFIGANGISLSAGISTPDRNEASIKSVVIAHSRTAYVLSDHSKFDQIASVTFAKLNQVQIITDRLGDRKYLAAANIREVM